jgi:hypothetical protein
MSRISDYSNLREGYLNNTQYVSTPGSRIENFTSVCNAVAGQYCLFSNKEVKTCPVHHYCDTAKLEMPTPCPPKTANSKVGSTSQNDCNIKTNFLNEGFIRGQIEYQKILNNAERIGTFSNEVKLDLSLRPGYKITGNGPQLCTTKELCPGGTKDNIRDLIGYELGKFCKSNEKGIPNHKDQKYHCTSIVQGGVLSLNGNSKGVRIDKQGNRDTYSDRDDISQYCKPGYYLYNVQNHPNCNGNKGYCKKIPTSVKDEDSTCML